MTSRAQSGAQWRGRRTIAGTPAAGRIAFAFLFLLGYLNNFYPASPMAHRHWRAGFFCGALPRRA